MINSANSSNDLLLLIEIDRKVTFYSAIFVLFPGIVLNFMVLFLFRNKVFTKSVRFFYTILTLMDLSNLIYVTIIVFPGTISNIDITNQPQFTCKFVVIIIRFLSHASSWSLVVICYDRIFSIFFIDTYKAIFGKKYLYGFSSIALIVSLLSSSINLNAFLGETIIFIEKNRTTIQYRCTFASDIGLLINMSSFILRTILPHFFMFSGNILLIRKLFGNKSQLHKLGRKEYEFGFTIISMNYVYFLLNLPLVIVQIYEYMPFISTIEQRALSNLLYRVAAYIMYANQAYSSFFYLRFNKIFRRTFLKYIKRLNEVNIMIS
jgi:hypothetical protein